MSNQGWIKLHRELMDKPIWISSTPEQKSILITLLMMANYYENEWEWQGEQYIAKPGEFVTSLQSIVNNAGKGISIQNVRTALNRFEKYGFLTSKSTNKNRLITIVNWELYQGTSNEDNKKSNKQLTSNQQAANKQLTTNKESKNIRNKESKNNIKSFSSQITDYTPNIELQETLNDFVETRNKLKSPFTDIAFTRMLNKLDNLANNDSEKIEIINNSIINGWKGIFELKDKPTKGEAHHENPIYRNFGTRI